MAVPAELALLRRRARRLRTFLPSLLVAACSAIGAPKDGVLEASAAARFPDCAREIQAYFALNRLAMQSGSNAAMFEPAMEALQDQMTDCVHDSYGGAGNIWPITGDIVPGR